MMSPDARIFTPYGATEAMPVSVIGSREILIETRYETDQGKGICVGIPVEHMTAAVIKVTEEPIAQWKMT